MKLITPQGSGNNLSHFNNKIRDSSRPPSERGEEDDSILAKKSDLSSMFSEQRRIAVKTMKM